MEKVKALASYLEITADEALELIDDERYLVLTNKEADQKAREEIEASLWAFNPSFLAAHAIPGVDESHFKSLQDNNQCESNTPVIRALIADLEHFIDDATRADGRGHFISHYDGEEIEAGNFLIYRMN